MEEMPPKRVKELQLSEEEANLKGAPEGTVYEIAVLLSSEIEPSHSPEAELNVRNHPMSTLIHPHTHKSLFQHALSDIPDRPWADQHAAVDSIRRITIHHPSLVIPHL